MRTSWTARLPVDRHQLSSSSQVSPQVSGQVLGAAVIPPLHAALDHYTSSTHILFGGAAVIPPFHAALDRCLSYLEPQNGLLGVADFYVSAKHDLPLRQQPWARRFFWQATFDTDGISIGPERRAYLDTRLSRLWEMNSQVSWIL